MLSEIRASALAQSVCTSAAGVPVSVTWRARSTAPAPPAAQAERRAAVRDDARPCRAAACRRPRRRPHRRGRPRRAARRRRCSSAVPTTSTRPALPASASPWTLRRYSLGRGIGQRQAALEARDALARPGHVERRPRVVERRAGLHLAELDPVAVRVRGRGERLRGGQAVRAAVAREADAVGLGRGGRRAREQQRRRDPGDQRPSLLTARRLSARAPAVHHERRPGRPHVPVLTQARRAPPRPPPRPGRRGRAPARAAARARSGGS